MTESRFGPISHRLVLLAIVIGGTGLLLGALTLPTAVAVNSVVDAVDDQLFDVPPLPDVGAPPANSFVYAADGTRLAEINYEESRIPVPLERVPEVTRDAIIATEDDNFWSHNGVNHRAIVRAAMTNLRAGGIEQGGSTITQQLVKMAYIGVENADQTYDRKLREALWAIELEQEYTKEEILERYLNHVYLGNGAYGVGKAAERYFSKAVDDLTLAESAMLAAVIRNPTINDPVAAPEAVLARRAIVLDQMAGKGLVTEAQAGAAKDLPLGLDLREPRPPREPFWVDYVTRLLTDRDTAEGLGTHVDALEAMGATAAERIQTVFQGGLRIHTTVDPRLQDLSDAAIREHLTAEGETPAGIAQEPFGAIVSVEPGTGAVKAMGLGPRAFGSCGPDGADWIGPRDDGRLFCDRTQINPAVPGGGGSGRQPGSSFKPFVVAAALEQGLPPGWQVEAYSPSKIPGCDAGGDWEVRNSGGSGTHDMYTGVKASSNVFHAKLIKATGPDNVKQVAERLGVRHGAIPPECSIALGSADVYPVDMAAAYATLANRGGYCPPAFISRIEDREGNLLYEYTPRCEQVIDEDIADRVVDIMEGPVTYGGTAPAANLGRWPTRGKTGTTQDFRDAWFVGFVKQLATAAWVGFPNGAATYDCGRNPGKCQQEADFCFAVDDATNTRDCIETRYLDNVSIAGRYYGRVFGGTLPAPMWKTYMQPAVEPFAPQGFPEPGPMPTALVPNLLNNGSTSSAEDEARRAGLNFDVDWVTHWAPSGSFVGQSPGAGARVPAGRLVEIQISNGRGARPTVPYLIGETAGAARAALASKGYGVSTFAQATSDAAMRGRVVSQSPGGGTELLPGGTVRLGIGDYTAPPPPEPEDDQDEQVDEGNEDRKKKDKDKGKNRRDRNGDQGNDDQGNDDQGNGDQGNGDQGNGDQGNGDQGNGDESGDDE